MDILVNNAGVFNPKPFLEVNPAEYDWFLDTILKGKFFSKRSINPVLVDGVCFQEAKAEAGEQFHGSSAS